MSSPHSPLTMAPDDQPAGAPLTSWYTQGVTDGFGDRLLMFDNAATGPVELLRVRADFAGVAGFEAALRARFDQLSSFTHPGFAQARVVNHLENGGGLTVASTHVPGTRLSELFVAARPTPGMHPASVREAFGDLVAAIAELHRQGRGLAHGALSAERILLTFDRRLIVTDYVFGEALQRLNLTREQLWSEFGLVCDTASGGTSLDQRGDLAQLALLMASLVIGRRVSPGEYPHKMPALLRDFTSASDKRAPDVTASLRTWLEQAIDPAGFGSVAAAERALAVTSRRPHSIDAHVSSPADLTSPGLATPTDAVPGVGPSDPTTLSSQAAAPPQVAPPTVPIAAPLAAVPLPPPALDAQPLALASPRAAASAPVELPVPELLHDQPNVTRQPLVVALPPVAPSSSPFATSAAPVLPVGAVPQIVTQPTAAPPDAYPARRPEPFSWIGGTELEADVDPVVANAESSTTIWRWVSVALGILAIAQGVIIFRLLSRQPSAVSGSTPINSTASGGTVVPGNTPTGVAPLIGQLGDQNSIAEVIPPATAAPNNPAPAGAPQTPARVPRPETPARPQRVDAAPARTGGVRVVSPIRLQVIKGEQLLGLGGLGLGPVFMTPGDYELDFVNNPLGFRVKQQVLVAAGQVLTVRINPPNGSMSLTAQPSAQVWIDGRLVGDTPLDASVPLGEHEVIFRNAQLGERRQRAVVQAGSLTRVSASFNP